MFLEYLYIKHLAAIIEREGKPFTHLLPIENLLNFVLPFNTLNANKLRTAIQAQASTRLFGLHEFEAFKISTVSVRG
jgi:hypothetical protein